MNVTQTDGTKLAFGYDSNKRVNYITAGNASKSENNNNFKGTIEDEKSLGATSITTYRFDYSKYPIVTCLDGNMNSTQLTVDGQGRLVQMLQQQGYDTPDLKHNDITTYSYLPTGQLGCIKRPDASQELFEHDQFLGFITKHTQPNGQITEYYYSDTSTDRPKLTSKVDYLDSTTPLVTRYVYDNNYDNQNARHAFLRFEISPTGRVTEYEPNPISGKPHIARTYLANVFNITALNKRLAPSLNEMLEWVKQQDPQKVSLTEFNYNSRAQPEVVHQYAKVDKDGKGDPEGRSEQATNWDRQGGWIRRNIKQDDNNTSQTVQAYDGLHRLTSKVEWIAHTEKEDVKRTTTYNYLDAQGQVEVILPNQRKETKQFNKSGLLESITTTITDATTQETQTRTTSFKRDTGGRIVETLHPDQELTFTFFDRQQRLGFTVSRTGIVNQIEYDRQHNYTTHITYAKKIDVSQLTDSKFMPTVAKLMKLIEKSPDADRYSYEFKDASNRLRYQVDADGALIEYRYDNLNRLRGKIEYNTRITADELAQLQQGQALQREPDTSKDRYWRHYYDGNNQKLAEQDPAGYVTYYKRDAGGRVYEKIGYANPTQAIPDFNKLPVPDAVHDAHTYYFYDNRGQCIVKINSEGSYIQHEYYTNGLKKQTRTYSAKVDSTWFNNPNKDTYTQPPAPTASLQDQITFYQFDLLKRNTAIIDQANTGENTPTQNLKGIYKQYDEMDNLLEKDTKDLLDPTSISPDKQRSTQTQYDQWGQTLRETNPFDLVTL